MSSLTFSKLRLQVCIAQPEGLRDIKRSLVSRDRSNLEAEG